MAVVLGISAFYHDSAAALVKNGDTVAAAEAGDSMDRSQIDDLITGLDKREFLLHNVHEDEPALFRTRWVLSYLAGPLTRDHIRTLMKTARNKLAAAAKAVSKPKRKSATTAPALPPSIDQFHLCRNKM